MTKQTTTTYHFTGDNNNPDKIVINLRNESQAIMIRNAIRDQMEYYQKWMDDDADMQEWYEDAMELYESLVDFQFASK